MAATHNHSIIPTSAHGHGENADGERVHIVCHEVTCVFEDDPTSDDAIVVGQVWLEDGEAEDGFPCPVCGDEIATTIHGAPNRPQWTEHYQLAASPPCAIPEGK